MFSIWVFGQGGLQDYVITGNVFGGSKSFCTFWLKSVFLQWISRFKGASLVPIQFHSAANKGDANSSSPQSDAKQEQVISCTFLQSLPPLKSLQHKFDAVYVNNASVMRILVVDKIKLQQQRCAHYSSECLCSLLMHYLGQSKEHSLFIS